ncbi:SDR family NAD(P)-dependent oxidoreductase [Chloroflexota bacterium]
MARLTGKVALITGGARGIGKQIALTFAHEGADIVIGDVLDMEETGQEIKSLGRKAITVSTDVSNRDQVHNLVDTAIKGFNKIDILVNNAGVIRHATLFKDNADDWDTVLSINLKGNFLCTQAVAIHMKERSYGKIINMASIGGITVALRGNASYAASKAGVIQITRIYSQELGRYGINVNAIAPGLVLTDMAHFRKTEEKVEQDIQTYKEKVALSRIGTTQDIANLALFLASDESSFITGQVIVADGGWFAK